MVQRNSDNGFTEAQLPSAARAADGIVMLAEDNADMRDYIRRLLEQRFTVVTARDGRRGAGTAPQEASPIYCLPT